MNVRLLFTDPHTLTIIVIIVIYLFIFKYSCIIFAFIDFNQLRCHSEFNVDEKDAVRITGFSGTRRIKNDVTSAEHVV